MSCATLCAQWPGNLVHGEANGHDRGDGLPANAKFGDHDRPASHRSLREFPGNLVKGRIHDH